MYSLQATSTLSYQRLRCTKVLPESMFQTAFAGFYAINGDLRNWNKCQQISIKGIPAFLNLIQATALSLSPTKNQ